VDGSSPPGRCGRWRRKTAQGINNRQEALPMIIDPQYVVGFTWARQYGFRIVKDFGGKLCAGAFGGRTAGDAGRTRVLDVNEYKRGGAQ